MTDNNASQFGGRLLIGATGSGAVAMLPMYLSALRAQFTGTVTVLMTHTAATFLPAHTMALFADKVVTADSPASWPIDNHVSLAAEHDLMAVLPATANTLAAAASGAAPNLLGTTLLHATYPVVFFPVMTGDMWTKPAVQRNVTQLREDGYAVVEPDWGPRYDVGLKAFVDSPMPPAPPKFIQQLRSMLS
ncbi:flavoprotein [Kribbella sp. NPDC051770]|uniref:flavoprotein n=1 Tax=Kribbella sp. NPDC051770 TaxID=3155413 RepID=UPI003415C43D